MKYPMHSWAVLCLSFLLAGCGIGGFWMTGDPSAGKDAKPYLQHWEKPGWTPESRRVDSSACGTIGNDDYGDFSPATIKAAQRPGETERETRTRLRQDWLHCMKEKGYQWVK